MPSVRTFKPKNLVRQEATPSQKDYFKQIIPYGNLDNFPLRLAQLVQNSPTGQSCIDTKTDFIEGAGFSDPTLGDKIINGLGERFGDIHHLNSDFYGLNEGFALIIKYNRKPKISELYSVPFEHCRFGIPDSKGVISKILVNPHFGDSEYDQRYTKEYDVYNPSEKAVLSQQERDKGKYKGQILYCGSTGPLSRFYPAPKYYSCHKWMAIEEAIGTFHKNNIDSNFFISTLMKLVGNENTASTHPDDMTWNKDTNAYEENPSKTMGMRFEIEMQKFLGAESQSRIMTLWAETAEAMAKIEPFQSNANAELFKTLADLCTEIIARATKVPSVLANIASGASLGGDGNLIRASVKLMQQRVIKTQSMFERIYKDLLSRMEEPYMGDVKILHYNPFPEMEVIDPLIWAALTLPEQRAWIKKNTAFEIVEVEAQPAQVASPTNKFSNVSYSSYPSEAKAIAKKAKDYRDKTGSNCGGKGGWTMTDEIIDGKPLSFKTIKRIHNYLKKNEGFKDGIFSDSCESLLFSAWGGSVMLAWTGQLIESINE